MYTAVDAEIADDDDDDEERLVIVSCASWSLQVIEFLFQPKNIEIYKLIVLFLKWYYNFSFFLICLANVAENKVFKNINKQNKWTSTFSSQRLQQLSINLKTKT